MYNSFQLAKKYLRYYFTSANAKGHGTHSPFIFDFILHVLNDKKQYPAYPIVEGLRGDLLNNPDELVIADFGAGSAMDKTNKRKISSIARHAAKSRKYGQLLYRIAEYYKPRTILELGTSLGITTAYLSQAVPNARVVTMEGSSAIVSTAKSNFEKLQLRNIEIVEGNFEYLLTETVQDIGSIDLAFLDGNHRAEPTVRYFNTILGKINNGSIVLVDDIHWSAGMEEAWQEIKNNKAVKCTVDLFFTGIVFFRDEFFEKQHFTIRF